MTLVAYPLARLGDHKPLTEVEVSASLAVPWRTARLRSEAVSGQVTVEAGYHGRLSSLFEGRADDVGGDMYGRGDALLRGLPDWRREVDPQAFQDAHLETVLNWLATTCGGQIDLNVKGVALRHYQVRRVPAYQAVREALTAWRVEATLLELDGGVLHVGPEAETPHAKAGTKARLVAGRNILALSDVGGGRYRVEVPGLPELRLGHRVEVSHALVSGEARIVDIVHRWGGGAYTRMEVVRT